MRLEKAEAGPGALVTYYYTFINYDGDALADDAAAEMGTGLIEQTCTNEALQKAIGDGLKFDFLYANNVGATVASVSVTAEACRASGFLALAGEH